jgi:tetratricopeptide (TPR) repeat protein
MNLDELLPPADLLQKVGNIEQGLRQRRRLSRIGLVGSLIAAAIQILSLVDKWLSAPEGQSLRMIIDTTIGRWQFLAATGILTVLILLFLWTKYRLKESEEPFKYTFSVAAFTPLEDTSPAPAEASQSAPGSPSANTQAKLRWIADDLVVLLSDRVKRLSLLEHQPQSEGKPVSDEPQVTEAHIHIWGHYGTRVDPRRRRVLEIIPRVRVGPPGSEETVAQPTVRLPLKEEALRDDEYYLLLERLYFSVSSEIYRQIRVGVERKIALLPLKRLKRTAYFREAEDYARSATVDAYVDARRLFEKGFALRPSLGDIAECGDPAFGSRRSSRLRTALRSAIARVWPGFAKRLVLMAQAATGYANVLLYGSQLAMLSGRGETQMFQARRLARSAIDLLHHLDPQHNKTAELLFDTYLSEALACGLLNLPSHADPDGIDHLKAARQLRPSEAQRNARYLYVAGETEGRLLSRIPRFRRAAELDPRFEIAQFELATSWENLWRTRRHSEPVEAELILEEYERVTDLNPSNIGAWANRGYMLWLLGQLDRAHESFANGLEYKEVRRETDVAELHYGLARIDAEKGDVKAAYRHYTRFVASLSAQTESGSNFPLSYYFGHASNWLINRFDHYQATVEKHLAASPWADMTDGGTIRIARAVHAFVLNDWAECRWFSYLRSGHETLKDQAREAFRRASELNPRYVMPHYNLAVLQHSDWEVLEALELLERVSLLEPRWPQALLLRAVLRATKVWRGPDIAELYEGRANDKRAALRNLEEEERRADQARERRLGVGIENGPSLQMIQDMEANVREENVRRLRDEVARLGEKVELLRGGDDKSEWREDIRDAILAISSLLPHSVFQSGRFSSFLWKRRAGKDATSLIDSSGSQIRQVLKAPICWERELNDVHVAALVQWAGVLSVSEDPATLLAARLLCLHVETHFRQGFDVVSIHSKIAQGLLDLTQEHRVSTGLEGPSREVLESEVQSCRRQLRRLVRNALDEDPGSLELLSDPAFQDFPHVEKKARLRAAIHAGNRSTHFLRWLADSLERNGDKEGAVDALHQAATCTQGHELSKIAEQFSVLGRWDDSFGLYRRLRESGEWKHDVVQGEDHADSVLRMVAAQWAKGDRQEALRTAETAAWGTSEAKWRTETAKALLGRSGFVTHFQLGDVPGYDLLKDWLERLRDRAQREQDRAGWEDATRAMLYLVREKYHKIKRAVNSNVEPDPFVIPILVKADQWILPEENVLRKQPIHGPLFHIYLPEMRNRLREAMGVTVPGVRIRWVEDLARGSYQIFVKEMQVSSGLLQPGHMFIPGSDPLLPLIRTKSEDSSIMTSGSRLEGSWLDSSEAERAKRAGLEPWDHFRYLVQDLEVSLLPHLTSFLGVQEVQDLVSAWADSHHEGRWMLAEEALDARESLVKFELVLRALVREQVPIRRLDVILEVFASAGEVEVGGIVERVRLAIREDLPGNDSFREQLQLTSRLESLIARWAREATDRRILALPRSNSESAIERIRQELISHEANTSVLVIHTPGLRALIRRLTEIVLPALPVLAADEVLDQSLQRKGAHKRGNSQ